MWTEIKTFIQNIEFETWLSIISCLTGIVALFLGGSAYHNCKSINKSFNDEKELGDNSVDNSQKAGGDIVTYNYGCDTNALANLTSENFKTALNQAYEMFDKKTESNLKRIIEEAGRIIKENQINLGSYTKLDWINIYFENAKTASDEYMQNVWAKVLACELEKPDSFSYKTLDVLKNMTSDDFRLFEKLCSLSTDNYILSEDIYAEYELLWLDKLHLSELGLLSLEHTESSYLIKSKSKSSIIYLNQYIIIFDNDLDKEVVYKLGVHTLTTTANELRKIVNVSPEENFIYDFVKALLRRKPSNLKISLHKIKNMNNGHINYNLEDLSKRII